MAKKKLTLKVKKGGMNSKSRSRSRSRSKSKSRSRSRSKSKSRSRSRSKSKSRSKPRIDPYTARSKIDGFRFLDLYLDVEDEKYMPGSTIPEQKRVVESLLEEEGSIAKGRVCQGLPKELVHTMIEKQVETGYTPKNCGALRLLCQNPSCEKHCWNSPSKTKEVIDGCKEVIKVNRCLSVLDDYKIIREDYKALITDNYDLDYAATGLSYFHLTMKKRIEYPPPFGPYKLMIGDYDDEEVDIEIRELNDELSNAKGVEERDRIQEQLFQANKEKIVYKLPKAARPYVFTSDEEDVLKKLFNEKDDVPGGQVHTWSKYTMKSVFNYFFGNFPELFQDLCLLFMDDNLDEDGDEIFTRDELIQNGYPDGESFINGVIIMDINEALDLFFEGDMNTWNRMLQVFENKGYPEEEKNFLKQIFLNIIGFLDGLYIKHALNNLSP